MPFRRQPKRPPTPSLIELGPPMARPRRRVRRRPPPSPLLAEVRAHLERPWLLDAAFIEGLASKAHEDAHLRDPFDPASGDVLAARLGYLVIRSHRAACGGGCLLARTLLVCPSADNARWNLRVLHEFAHALLDEEKKTYAESDAWALALALAVPRGVFRRRAEAHHVPRWAVLLREQTARAR